MKIKLFLIGFFVIIGIYFVSAQVLNQNPVVTGVVPTSSVPTSCAFMATGNATGWTTPSETDNGVDPTTPGVVSGTFYDLANPTTIICGNYQDTCSTNNYLIETVWGGSPNLGPSITGGSMPNQAGAVEIDCSSLNSAWTCNQGPNGGYCGSPLPDLIVSNAFVISPAPSATINVVVSNIGQGPAGQSSTSVFACLMTGSVCYGGQQTTPAILPGASTTLTFNLPVTTPGTYTVSMNTDSLNVVTESNEINNFVSGPFNL